ncbi:hypothetical protein M758_1G291600 [Ceratodon purpureus]|nr:hypothetical protein M758_1G291600 [Ceratodon purpureus]
MAKRVANSAVQGPFYGVRGWLQPCCWAMVVVMLTMQSQMGMVVALRVGYYAQSCPNAEGIVRNAMARAMQRDTGTAPGVLRLHFHDCFVDGCDGSVLLEGPNSEKAASPNLSLRGFEVVDEVKADLEAVCPGVVSCADILAFGARDAVEMTGGVGWAVPAGRLDGRFSSAASASANIPDPAFDVGQLNNMFARKGLSQSDMIVLSGAHSIGRAHCVSVKNGSPLKAACQGGATFNLDPTPNRWDNAYYANVINQQGVMNSDQILFDDVGTRAETTLNAVLDAAWQVRFSQVIVRMGNIGVKTGPEGEVRRNCRFVN